MNKWFFIVLVRGGLCYIKLAGGGGQAIKLCPVLCVFGFNCSVPETEVRRFVSNCTEIIGREVESLDLDYTPTYHFCQYFHRIANNAFLGILWLKIGPVLT